MPETRRRRIRYFRDPEPAFVSLVDNPATGRKFEVIRMVGPAELAAQNGGTMPHANDPTALPPVDDPKTIGSVLRGLLRRFGGEPEAVQRSVPEKDFRTQWDEGRAQSDLNRAQYLLSDYLWWLIWSGDKGTGGLTSGELAAAETALRQYGDVVMAALRTVKRDAGEVPALLPAAEAIPALVGYLSGAEVVDRKGKKISGSRQERLTAALKAIQDGGAALAQVLAEDGDAPAEGEGGTTTRSGEDDMSPELEAALKTLNDTVSGFGTRLEAVERAAKPAEPPPAPPAAPEGDAKVLEAVAGIQRSVEEMGTRLSTLEKRSATPRGGSDDPAPGDKELVCRGFFRVVEGGAPGAE